MHKKSVFILENINVDIFFNSLTIFLGIVAIGLFFFIFKTFIEIKKHKRHKIKDNSHVSLSVFILLLLILPYWVGIGLLFHFLNYDLISVPYILLLICLIFGMFFFYISKSYPRPVHIRQRIIAIVLSSLATGGTNALFIFLIVNAFTTKLPLPILLYCLFLTVYTFILSKKFAETKLIRMTMKAIYDYRIKLIDSILLTTFQNFEKIDKGRVLEILNGDTRQIGSSAALFVTILTCIVTITFAFGYMFTISVTATLCTILLSMMLTLLYYVVSQKAEAYFEKAKFTENRFMLFIDNLIRGFKELCINQVKKDEFGADMYEICRIYRESQSIANIKFINVSLIGNTIIMSVIGLLVFVAPIIFPHLHGITLMSFVMILLYLVGPIDAVVHTMPTMVELKVSWKRIQTFLKDMPSNSTPSRADIKSSTSIKNFSVENIIFTYPQSEEHQPFQVGPIQFTLSKGEILFITGGNGSGKSTLAKLLTGLYTPDSGTISINGNTTKTEERCNYFSTVFADYHLFDKFYGLSLKNKQEEVNTWLHKLKLNDKLEITNGKCFSSHLSNGQKKRLALFQCLMEDKPIFLLDEWAADQDPEYRKYFYEQLIPFMKKAGKIVIVITHDDSYFQCADKLIKFELGKMKHEICQRKLMKYQ